MKDTLCPPLKKNPNCDQYQNILSRTITNDLPSLCGLSPEIPTLVNQCYQAQYCAVALLGQGMVPLGGAWSSLKTLFTEIFKFIICCKFNILFYFSGTLLPLSKVTINYMSTLFTGCLLLLTSLSDDSTFLFCVYHYL